MHSIEIGARYRFGYPAASLSLSGYTAHAGQPVTVIRYLNSSECDDELTMFKVRADDGWLGQAFDDELEPLDAGAPADV